MCAHILNFLREMKTSFNAEYVGTVLGFRLNITSRKNGMLFSSSRSFFAYITEAGASPRKESRSILYSKT